MLGLITLVILILVIGLVVSATMMEKAAAEKGYGKEAHAFAMCFCLGIIGCIYVAALPDKIRQNQNQQIIEMMKEMKGQDN
ncbi:MAG: hypothetical protein ACI4QZ_04365 [Eubacteriales bacterium]